MDNRDVIKWVLDEAAIVLCKDLDPAKIIRILKAKHVLDGGDESEIRGEKRLDDKVDRLLSILKRKPPAAYHEFIDALYEVREDLYCDVMKIEERANSGKNTSIVTRPLGQIFAVIPRSDITIRKSLGTGGFGRVHLATHKMWGTVAVKRFERIVLTDHILKEAEKMIRAIRSPYIVHIMGLMEESNSLSIVMEFVENGNLKNFNRKYMDCDCWTRKVKMLMDISLGMNYLHTLDPPIFHLDLKLENVFVGNGFEAKIGDLGLAMTETSAKRYQMAAAQGTVSHIPPEGWNTSTKAPDKFWDIFMFAITSFELLSGLDPWPKFATPTQISVWVTRNKRPDLSQIAPEAPRDLIVIMKQCWNGRTTDRPQFQEIQEKISRIYHTRYEMDINAANIAIRQRKPQVDSLEGTFQQIKLGGDQTTSKTDSGVGSSAESHATISHGQATLKDKAHRVQQWRIVKEFGKKGSGQGEFKMARGIAVCNNNDIVVVDGNLNEVYLFSQDGGYKYALVSPRGNTKAQLICPRDVAVTSQGRIAVVDASANPEISKHVKVFNVNGTYLYNFATHESYTKVTSESITVGSDGKVLVGDTHGKCVTIQAGSFGGLSQAVSLNIKPQYLATNSHHNILVSDGQAREVVAVDCAGRKPLGLYKLNSFMVSGQKGVPGGLACGDDDTLYISVKELNESTGAAFTNTGHIHQYSPEGRFMQCLIKGLYYPRGIAWYNDSLYVANDKSVVILSKSSSP